jgi:hypothetical protein
MCASPAKGFKIGSSYIPIEDCAWSVSVGSAPQKPLRVVAMSQWFPEPSCSRIIFFIYPGSSDQVKRCCEAFRAVADNRRPSDINPYPNKRMYVAIGVTPRSIFQIVYRGGDEIRIPIPNLQEFLQGQRN